MSWSIDTSNLEFKSIRNDILNYVKGLPDYYRWKDFFDSNAGNIIIDLIAAQSLFLGHKTTVAIREAFLQYAKYKSSIISNAESLGYNVNKGTNTILYLVVLGEEDILVPEYELVGFYGDKPLRALENTNIVRGEVNVVPVMVGNLISETITVESNDLQIFKFTLQNLSEEFRLFLNDLKVPLSKNFIDLIDDKYVALTNSFESVDVYFLNKMQNATTWQANVYYEIGDYVIATTGNNGIIFKCINNGYSGTTEPTWATYEGITIEDNDVLWESVVDYSYRVGDTLKIEGFEITEDIDAETFDIKNIKFYYGRVLNTTESLVEFWEANKEYKVGDIVISRSGTAYSYQCIQPGVSGSSEPTWGTTEGVEFIDGTVKWKTLSNKIITSPKNEPETNINIKYNAPLAFETKNLIRGRKDYMKLFRSLRTSIVDTNYRDVFTTVHGIPSPAIVELTYVNEDDSVFSTTEKNILISELSKYRTMGIPDPIISDPEILYLTLRIDIKLLKYGVYPINDDIRNILNSYERKLGKEIDFEEIENRIEDLSYNNEQYVKIARISPDFTTFQTNTAYAQGQYLVPFVDNGFAYQVVMPDNWQPNTFYNVGDYVTSTLTEFNGYVFVCISSGLSGSVEPNWVKEKGVNVIDDGVIWQVHLAEEWKSNYTYNDGDIIIPTIYKGFLYKKIPTPQWDPNHQYDYDILVTDSTNTYAFKPIQITNDWQSNYTYSPMDYIKPTSEPFVYRVIPLSNWIAENMYLPNEYITENGYALRSLMLTNKWENNKNYGIGAQVIPTNENQTDFAYVTVHFDEFTDDKIYNPNDDTAYCESSNFDIDKIVIKNIGLKLNEDYTIWQPTTYYNVGDMVIPTTPNGYIYVCTNGGTSGVNEPTWSTTEGDPTNDTGVQWITRVFNKVYSGTLEPTWSNFSYGAEIVVDTCKFKILSNNSFPPKSGFSEPLWSNTPGDYIIDNTLRWQTKIRYKSDTTSPDFSTINVGDNIVDGGVLWEVYELYKSGDVEPEWENYSVGDNIVDNGILWEVIPENMSGAVEPTWNTTSIGDTTYDYGVLWEYVEKDVSGTDEPFWSNVIGHYVIDNGVLWEVMSRFQSGDTEPLWSTTLGEVMNNGTMYIKTSEKNITSLQLNWNQYYIIDFKAFVETN